MVGHFSTCIPHRMWLVHWNGEQLFKFEGQLFLKLSMLPSQILNFKKRISLDLGPVFFLIWFQFYYQENSGLYVYSMSMEIKEK